MPNNCQRLFVRNGREKRNGGNEGFQARSVVLLPEDQRKTLKVQLPLKRKILKTGAGNWGRWGRMLSLEKKVDQCHSLRKGGRCMLNEPQLPAPV